ncbi:MAG TPA: hypothetical protein VML55_12875 [Planctomycetaceae bacterium]|nr:hypothetical protein [Planctomycetaceae bacterium]
MDSALALIEGRGPSSPPRFSAVEIALALTCLVQLAAVAWLASSLTSPGRRQPAAPARL